VERPRQLAALHARLDALENTANRRPDRSDGDVKEGSSS